MNKFEKFIIESINSKKYSPLDKIHSEAQLMSLTGVSKMTIRSSINKLINTGYLISVPKKGVYVSPFVNELSVEGNYFHFFKSKVKTMKSNEKEIPYDLRKFSDENMKSIDFISFIRFYYNENNELIAFSNNWIDKKTIKDEKKLLNANHFQINSYFKPKVVFNKISMLASTQFDRITLKEPNTEFIPTIFSIQIQEGSVVPQFFRMFTIKPKYFTAQNFKVFHNQD